ncbi:MAG: phosphate acyltransferase [Bdellovibrionaceae bacterium]|nr:phosphate acyltransferase [Pseudobdellovibrionaceae bacterium]
MINKVKSYNKKTKTKPRIVLPEGNSRKVLRAVQQVLEEGFAHPVIIGNRNTILKRADKNELYLIKNAEIISPEDHPRFREYAQELFKLRCRRGLLQSEVDSLLKDPHYFAAMMVRMGDADGVVSGASQSYAKCVKPLLEAVGVCKDRRAAGANIVLIDGKMFFFADTTMCINPNAETLAHIALDVADLATSYGQTPRVAMLSYTNFSGDTEGAAKMKFAAELAKKYRPDLIVDGEMQADAAVNPTILNRLFPFSELKDGGANILVFPNLDAANISYKIIQQLSHAEVVGPLLLGMKKPCNIVQRTGLVGDIVNALALVAHDITQRQTQPEIYAH